MISIRQYLQKVYEKGFKDGQQDLWTLYNVSKPKKEGFYLVTIVFNENDWLVSKEFFSETHNAFMGYEDLIIAWQPMPERYIGEK